MKLDELLRTENLIAWLETKLPDGFYSYRNKPRCVLSSYFYENGYPNLMAGPYHIDGTIGEGASEVRVLEALPPGWDDAAHGPSDVFIKSERDPLRTYGAMLRRLTETVE